jgi:parallel beta-helix repeat protein
MKKLILAFVLTVILKCGIASADTHYVSPYGSDTYPYTSWATAADSIMKAMNAAEPGDTLMVGAGDYYPDTTIVMKDSVSLVGVGMDSCRIHGDSSFDRLINLGNWSLLEGFHVMESFIGIRGSVMQEGPEIVRNNKVTNCCYGLDLGYVSITIENNIISDNQLGITLGFGSNYLITKNTFRDINGYSIMFEWTEAVVSITNNLIDASNSPTPATWLATNYDSTYFANNIIYGPKWDGFYGGFPWPGKAVLQNNTVAYCGGDGIDLLAYELTLVNNISSTNTNRGIRVPEGGEHHLKLLYNNAWNNSQADTVIEFGVIRDSTEGNISVDPMFVDSLDFHLQQYSPCIDAGDPNIKDPDSSRSDIGAFGGPLGQTYTYLDYPPKAPDSLSAASENTVIVLSWKPNTESDLSHYVVYKDTMAFFIPDSSKMVAEVSKDSSVFRDLDFILGNTYYYQISAWDLTGHESPYSEELEVLATWVWWEDETQVMTRTYQLHQNYPNPFNPQTTICYYLPDIGYQPAEVELKIYNILGKLVRVLVSERQYPGEHRVVWDGKNDRSEDLASGVYFYRLKVSGIEFVKARKMVLVR